MKTANNQEFFDALKNIAIRHNQIDPSLYPKYNVKRGLRNSDGTGVLVGLTEIGDVHGYVIDENEKVPVEGALRYRGIDVQQLVSGYHDEKRFGFEEVCYLLLFGELPSQKRFEQFKQLLDQNRELPEGFWENMILKAPSSDVMNKLARSVLASYSYDSNPDDISVQNVLRQSFELIARFPTMIAYAFQAKAHYYDGKSLFIHKPEAGLSTAENFFKMVRPDSKYTHLEAEILDLSLILHAEHGGGNNSAFACHVVTSSDTDTYSAIAAAVGSLKGPKHGGANIKVIQMMDELKRSVSDWKNEGQIREYLAKLVRKQAFDRSGLVYGMGHAVYTLSDPRTNLLKQKASDLSVEKQRHEELKLYNLVEKLAPTVINEEKKSDKPIAANVDFYSGLVYSMLNIPTDLFTPIFAMSRISGWCAHRIEEIVSGGKIIRPAYKNVLKRRAYIPLHKRKEDAAQLLHQEN